MKYALVAVFALLVGGLIGFNVQVKDYMDVKAELAHDKLIITADDRQIKEQIKSYEDLCRAILGSSKVDLSTYSMICNSWHTTGLVASEALK